MDIPGELQRARNAAGLSQRELSARTGVPQPRIAEYETDRRTPSASRLDLLLRGCGVALQATPSAGPRRVDPHDRQLLLLNLDLTPAERLAAFSRRARLQGAALR